MKIEIISCLQDNYSYLIIDETNNNACVVDPSEAIPVINFLEKTVEDDDRTGIGTLAAAYANRGIIKDRNKNYEEALQDYVKALGIDGEAVAGPGLGTIILNYKLKSSSVKERALYLNEQLQLPEDQRILSIKELDEGQVMHKSGKL